MIPVTVSIWSLPLVLAVWAINAYLFATALRIILGQLPSTRYSPFCQGLSQLTDPPVWALQARIEQWLRKPVIPWFPWAIMIAFALIVRGVCVALLVALSQKGGNIP